MARLTASHSTTCSPLPNHLFALCLSVWVWPLPQPTMKTNILQIKGDKTPTALHLKVCRLCFFMTSLYPAQPVSTYRLIGSLGGKSDWNSCCFCLSVSAQHYCSKGTSRPRTVCADVHQGLLVDSVKVQINYTHTHRYANTHSLIGTIATISSEH